MYSPKISEDLIPELYRISKEIEKPMTKVVDEILRNYIYICNKHHFISPIAIKNTLELILENEETDFLEWANLSLRNI